MSKRGSLIYQIVGAFEKIYKPGTTKKHAKINNEEYVIRAQKTCDVYTEIVCRILVSIRKITGATKLDELLAYVPEYIMTKAESDRFSMWTIKLWLSAFAKFQGCKSTEILPADYKLNKRLRSNIWRSRMLKNSIPQFSEKKNPDAVAIGKYIGLRRHEYPQINETQIIGGLLQPGWRYLDKADVVNGLINPYWEGYLGVYIPRGKGGLPRWIPVYPGMEELLLEIFTRRASTRNGKVFFAYEVRSHMDCHSYRRKYAKAMYTMLMSRPDTDKTLNYHCRRERKDEHFSTSCAKAVSGSLGHRRVDVAVNNYL